MRWNGAKIANDEYITGLATSYLQVYSNMQNVLDQMGILAGSHDLFDRDNGIWCYDNGNCDTGNPTWFGHIQTLADTVNLPPPLFFNILRYDSPSVDPFMLSDYLSLGTPYQTWWKNDLSNAVDERFGWK